MAGVPQGLLPQRPHTKRSLLCQNLSCSSALVPRMVIMVISFFAVETQRRKPPTGEALGAIPEYWPQQVVMPALDPEQLEAGRDPTQPADQTV